MTDYDSFVNDGFSNEIFENVVKYTFPELNREHQSLLHNYLIDIIDVISIKFNFDTDKLKYYTQFRQNNYKDSIALLYTILPFIDGTQDKKLIKSLNDIYVHKKKNIDINDGSPKYTFSNLQYNRCIRGKYITERKFDPMHLEHNVMLLKNTIDVISCKLFVNWIDVLPCATNNNIRSDETTKVLAKGKLKEWNVYDKMDTEGRKYRGFTPETIYNTFITEYYEKVKNIKWLIYDAFHDNTLVSYFDLIQIILPLETIIKFVQWNKLPDNIKITFTERWKLFIESASKNIQIGNINIKNLKNILKALVYFFNKYGNDLNNAIRNGYVPFEIDKIIDDNDYDEGITGVKLATVITSAKTIKPNYIYDFILDQIKLFKNTILPYNQIDKDAMKNFSNDGFIITPKNYYNFAKSLSHEMREKEYVYMGNRWVGLSSREKNMILGRLNIVDLSLDTSSKLMSWFNISKSLKLVGYYNDNSITQVHIKIYILIKKIIGQMIANMLIFRGTYSEFVPNPNISDSSKVNPENIKEIQNKVRELIMNKKKIKLWDKCYHFITGKRYNEMGPYDTDSGKMNYYDYMVKKQFWYTTYAMNWISQISFFHKYINNRIIFVTGSTGVGKSTQVPKLLLYALKAIDYNDKGRIVCTQPRIPPTIGNATRIANELYTPIKVYNPKLNKDVIANNYSVQFKHQYQNHMLNHDGLILKIVTDGTLYLELKNPYLKKRIYQKKDYYYQKRNVYDIVIVDEAHEHNTNMDLILTMMRNTLLNNNSIKLIIISATMDDDEPIYRRYYRDINDNQMYPFDSRLEEYKLDRINVDRRLHISPPGSTTRFKIDENYVPTFDPHTVIMDIINSSSSGDILLFQSGEADIMKSVQFLNQHIPNQNIIALPYFSSMDESKRDEIQNIDSVKDNIVVAKDADYKYFIQADDGKNKNKVPKGTYTRVILVATNIAEASITISSLKYVVDTGKQKIGLYDSLTGDNSLVEIPISESSRLQRKGRVGRTGSGTVYYMYEKGAMENNVTPYNISVSDISDNLFTILRDSYLDTQKTLDLSEINSIDQVDKTLYDFVVDQYFIDGVKIKYNGNNMHYDYENIRYPPTLYKTGFGMDTLTDNSGKFYIIHPEELMLNRNIDGKIIGIKNNANLTYNNNSISSIKINSFWGLLEERLFIILSGGEMKTEFGLRLNKLKETMKLENIKYLISYIFSRKYSCDDELIKIIPIIDLCINSKISPNRWAMGYMIDGKYRTHIDKLRALYGNQYGDIIGLLKCINKFMEMVNVFKIIPSESRIYELDEQKTKYIKFINNEINDIDSDIYNKFRDLDMKNKLELTGSLTENEKFELVKNDINYDMQKLDIVENESLIKKWCTDNYVEYSTMVMYLKQYARFNNQIIKIKRNAYDYDTNEKNDDITFEWFDGILNGFGSTGLTKEENIIISLLHAYNNKVCRNIDSTPLYYNISNPSPEFIFSLKTLNKFTPLEDTIITSKNQYILYMAKDTSGDIYMLQNVTPTMIQRASLFLYTPKKLSQINDSDYYNRMIKYVLESINTDNKKKVIDRYVHTINKTNAELINAYDNNILDKLREICGYIVSKDINISNVCLNRLDEMKKNNMEIIKNKSQKGGHKFIINSLTEYCAGIKIDNFVE